MFKLFWERSVKQAEKLNIEEPVLPRKRKAPHHLEVGTSAGTVPDTPEDRYKSIYFEALDTVSTCISDRFDQEGNQMYRKLEQLLITRNQLENDTDGVLKLYGNDFTRDTLLAQLDLFHTNYPLEGNISVHDIIKIMKAMSVAEKALFAEVVKLVRLLLVIPATNAVSERSFSVMHRIKTYLRSTMLQQLLNATMVMHIHKGLLTDDLDLKIIGNEFCAQSYYRKSVSKVHFRNGNI